MCNARLQPLRRLLDRLIDQYVEELKAAERAGAEHAPIPVPEFISKYKRKRSGADQFTWSADAPDQGTFTKDGRTYTALGEHVSRCRALYKTLSDAEKESWEQQAQEWNRTNIGPIGASSAEGADGGSVANETRAP